MATGKQVVLFGETLNKIESSRRQLVRRRCCLARRIQPRPYLALTRTAMKQLDGMDASFSKPVAGFIETEIVELSVRTYRPLSPYDATRKLT